MKKLIAALLVSSFALIGSAQADLYNSAVGIDFDHASDL